MKTIWKWSLMVTDHQLISLPRGAEILTVQMQGDSPQLWALCELDAPNETRETREIRIIGTGHQIPDEPGRYIGTFQMYGGSLVFHAFERPYQ